MALMHQFVASDNDRPQLQSGCQFSYVQVNYILAQMTLSKHFYWLVSVAAM